MDETPRTDRWLRYLALLLLVEAAVGFIPGLRQSDPVSVPNVVFSALAALAGGATLVAAAYRRSSPAAVRGFLWAGFIALAGMKFAAFLVFGTPGAPGVRYGSYQLFSSASWSLIGFGAPVLWGAAIARRNDPGSLSAQKVGRIAAGAVQLGFVFLFASEVRTMGMVRFSGGSGPLPNYAAAFGIAQAVQLADRILLLWSSIDSVRSADDEEMLRRRAARIHRLMSWWAILTVLSAVGSTLAFQFGMGTGGPRDIPYTFWRVAILQSVTTAIALAVALQFTSKLADTKSEVPA